MSLINLSRPCHVWVALLIGVVGCSPTEPDDETPAALNPAAMVPVGGTITANGKPLETLVITFLPANGPGVGTAETDKDGKYSVSSAGGAGILPGDYKVAISYLVSDTGEPQGLGPRSALIQPAGMRTAKEQIPPEYSDLGRTKLVAKVEAKGGQFDFNVPATISAPTAKPDEAKPAEAKPAESKSTEKKG